MMDLLSGRIQIYIIRGQLPPLSEKVGSMQPTGQIRAETVL